VTGIVKHAILVALLSAPALLGACADSATPADPTTELEQDATVCGVGPTVKGIDVSVYQGTINWAAVKAAGVEYALIRVSDGSFVDTKFDTNWAGSRAAHVIHGAYQFLRPDQDPIAQADYLLSKIGTMKADDLPPVVDVEVTDGLGPAAVASSVKKWVDHVKAKIGRAPIIYTGYYFWRDSVGGANDTTSPLWHAQYTTAACPTIADPWTKWAMWQYTSSGSISGISGNVDVDRWNGNLASLQAFLGPPGACGDGTCSAGETKISCPEDCGPCATIDAAAATTIDDSGACFEAGGPQAYMRHVTGTGTNNDLYWTHATSDATEANYGDWALYFATAGKYKVEVSTAAAYAQSKQAKYVVHAGTASHSVTLDQTAVDGWQTLGEFTFAAGGHQAIHLGDNTGEAAASNVQVVFDAVRVTPVDVTGGGSGSGSGSDMGTDPTDPMSGQHAGCSASGGGLGFALLAMFVGVRRRRRR
jgi:GH25 family lysozyme M1 (1,4-beta-N-acetylmuramidase)